MATNPLRDFHWPRSVPSTSINRLPTRRGTSVEGKVETDATYEHPREPLSRMLYELIERERRVRKILLTDEGAGKERPVSGAIDILDPQKPKQAAMWLLILQCQSKRGGRLAF